MSEATSILPPHGTPERWQAECDCSECQSAMQTKVWETDLDAPSFRTLREMLHFGFVDVSCTSCLQCLVNSKGSASAQYDVASTG